MNPLFRTILRTVALGAAASVAPGGPALAMPQDARVPGGVAILKIPAGASPAGTPPQGSFQGTRVMVVPRPDGWLALVGLSLALKPSTYEVEVSGAPRAERSFTVADKAYPEQRLTIKDKRKVTPPPDDLERIERERRVVEQVKQRFRDEPLVRDTEIVEVSTNRCRIKCKLISQAFLKAKKDKETQDYIAQLTKKLFSTEAYRFHLRC